MAKRIDKSKPHHPFVNDKILTIHNKLSKFNNYLPAYLLHGYRCVVKLCISKDEYIDLDRPYEDIKRYVLIYKDKLQFAYTIYRCRLIGDKWAVDYGPGYEDVESFIYLDKDLSKFIRDGDIGGPLLCTPFVTDVDGYCKGFKVFKGEGEKKEIAFHYENLDYTEEPDSAEACFTSVDERKHKYEILTIAICDMSDDKYYIDDVFCSSLCIQIIKFDSVVFCLGFKTNIRVETYIRCTPATFIDVEEEGLRYTMFKNHKEMDYISDFYRRLRLNPELIPSVKIEKIKDFYFMLIPFLTPILGHDYSFGNNLHLLVNNFYRFIKILLRQFVEYYGYNPRSITCYKGKAKKYYDTLSVDVGPIRTSGIKDNIQKIFKIC